MRLLATFIHLMIIKRCVLHWAIVIAVKTQKPQVETVIFYATKSQGTAASVEYRNNKLLLAADIGQKK